MLYKNTTLRKKVEYLIEDYDSNKIKQFYDVKAKALVEAMQLGDSIDIDELRFISDIDELREAFKITKKYSLKEDLGETEEVESLDKVQLFSDLADIESNLSSSINLLYQYKFQYVDDPALQKKISESRFAIAAALDKVNSILITLGTQGDRNIG